MYHESRFSIFRQKCIHCSNNPFMNETFVLYFVPNCLSRLWETRNPSKYVTIFVICFYLSLQLSYGFLLKYLSSYGQTFSNKASVISPKRGTLDRKEARQAVWEITAKLSISGPVCVSADERWDGGHVGEGLLLCLCDSGYLQRVSVKLKDDETTCPLWVINPSKMYSTCNCELDLTNPRQFMRKIRNYEQREKYTVSCQPYRPYTTFSMGRETS